MGIDTILGIQIDVYERNPECVLVMNYIVVYKEQSLEMGHGTGEAHK